MERWFKGKLDFDVNLPELPRKNLALLGGRVSSLRDVEVAALHYQLDGKDVSLFVMPLEKYRQLGLAGTPKFKIVTYQGYDVIAWASHGVAYSLVSEIGGQSCLVCHSSVTRPRNDWISRPASVRTACSERPRPWRTAGGLRAGQRRDQRCPGVRF